mmetsp:Transcript_17549/g.19862  ORF Transcript_17549/g.19862 Transcript_17549/m.19862 type:complete len:80 (+) Transcript_17549:17-256(+)
MRIYFGWFTLLVSEKVEQSEKKHDDGILVKKKKNIVCEKSKRGHVIYEFFRTLGEVFVRANPVHAMEEDSSPRKITLSE